MRGLPERVVLLGEYGEPIGSALKSEIHGVDTPLHLAFSCYVLDEAGRLLVTRRALTKLTWPGVWTNSFCGHPGPGEPTEDAVARRAHEELGAGVRDLRLVLPRFRYRALDASGVVENELCPVYVARIDTPISPVSSEVMDLQWIAPEIVAMSAARTPFVFSPWMVKQLPLLHDARAFGGERDGADLN